jgi:catechol 2,3-dioxygenase-like lactoylglutathione lyase family enzyme
VNTRSPFQAIRSIDYTVIFVRDMAAMRRFYEDVLGFPLLREFTGCATFPANPFYARIPAGAQQTTPIKSRTPHGSRHRASIKCTPMPRDSGFQED